VSIEAALFGTLGRDSELKTSKTGKQYLRLNVRVGDGDTATWVNVMAFDEQAIAGVDKLTKGARVYIEGTLRLDKWTAQDGTERHGLSVMSWHCRPAAIGRNKRERNDSSRPSVASGSVGGSDFHNDKIPFAPEWR
jgi:single-stranded DNA-binding protein